jgi:hypothetical protein
MPSRPAGSWREPPFVAEHVASAAHVADEHVRFELKAMPDGTLILRHRLSGRKRRIAALPLNAKEERLCARLHIETSARLHFNPKRQVA